jgi:hypothetical protein
VSIVGKSGVRGSRARIIGVGTGGVIGDVDDCADAGDLFAQGAFDAFFQCQAGAGAALAAAAHLEENG